MPPAPLPPDEGERLAALEALRILDTPAEEVFDSFARVASALFEAPIAAVSLIAADRHWFKAVTGLPGASELPRDLSFCAHAILEPGAVLSVPDATLDPRFADNPLVTGEPGVRFYAGAPVLDEGGFPLGALCVIDRAPRQPSPAALARLRDAATGVSAALRLHGAARRLDAQANRDALTGLGNRRAFEARLAAPAGADGATLLLLDLDGFKGINDAFGHPAGDAALREVARRLEGVARRGQEAYRLGGDEFALFVPAALEDAGVLAFGARVHAALAGAFVLEGQAVPLRTSIGAAVLARGAAGDAPGDAPGGGPGGGPTAAPLVPAADAALYEAKRAGRGTTRVHRATAAGGVPGAAGGPASCAAAAPGAAAAPSPAGGAGGRLDLEARLRRALAPPPGGEPFALAFQPVVDLAAGGVGSLEALVRWSPRPDGAVPPGEFVPLAERTGLAPRLDRWALRSACAAAAAWPRPWAVSVNVSAVTFGVAGVSAMVRDALAETGLAPGRLVVEMTETALAADAGRAGREVEALRALGVGVALDDLGAGHGSLLALRRHPFTEVKIDRGLVSGLDVDPAAARTVGFLAELGALLGVAVVAEGVERAAELREVWNRGVTRAQGFFLARPAAAGGVAEAARAAEARSRGALAAEAEEAR